MGEGHNFPTERRKKHTLKCSLPNSYRKTTRGKQLNPLGNDWMQENKDGIQILKKLKKEPENDSQVQMIRGKLKQQEPLPFIFPGDSAVSKRERHAAVNLRDPDHLSPLSGKSQRKYKLSTRRFSPHLFSSGPPGRCLFLESTERELTTQAVASCGEMAYRVRPGHPSRGGNRLRPLLTTGA